ncbi:translation protein SH3-like domain-containing protein [Phlyctochytrium arcticum]|nr:translation protein SH3-like domain-containing protein [Phlyctochytrium arcticum]
MSVLQPIPRLAAQCRLAPARLVNTTPVRSFLTVQIGVASQSQRRLAGKQCQIFHPPTTLQVRHRTFRKKLSRPAKRYLKWVEKLKAEGLEPPKVERPVMENKFWKVIGNMKVYKSITPGLRNRQHPTRFHLWKGSCVKRLSYGKRSTGGRNNTGKITVRHRGGGHKRRVRIIDFNRFTPGPHEVVRLEYDPNRSADLALLRNLSTNEFSYIICPADVTPGDIVQSWRQGIPRPAPGEDPIPKNQMIKKGNCLLLKDIPVGTEIHCIGLRADSHAQICRSAGTSGQLMYTSPTGMAQVRLSSKEVRLIPVNACATIGKVGNEAHQNTNLGKAGARRHLGWRPAVRGIAMSPVDHPHGGGGKSKGGKDPRSPWGWKTKGWKTVRRKKIFVLRTKREAKMGRS